MVANSLFSKREALTVRLRSEVTKGRISSQCVRIRSASMRKLAAAYAAMLVGVTVVVLLIFFLAGGLREGHGLAALQQNCQHSNMCCLGFSMAWEPMCRRTYEDGVAVSMIAFNEVNTCGAAPSTRPPAGSAVAGSVWPPASSIISNPARQSQGFMCGS